MVFLQPVARHRAGPQDPSDLLNDDDACLPLAIEERVILLAKEHVMLATYPGADDPRSITPQIMEVRLSRADGTTMDGAVEVEVRSDTQRLLDYLNGFEDRFFSMTVPGALHCLVNRRMIAGIQQR